MGSAIDSEPKSSRQRTTSASYWFSRPSNWTQVSSQVMLWYTRCLICIVMLISNYICFSFCLWGVQKGALLPKPPIVKIGRRDWWCHPSLHHASIATMLALCSTWPLDTWPLYSWLGLGPSTGQYMFFKPSIWPHFMNFFPGLTLSHVKWRGPIIGHDDWWLSFVKLPMVNVRCSWQLSFATLTMGDQLYRVVVSESKLGPTRQNQGLWIYSGVKMLL